MHECITTYSTSQSGCCHRRKPFCAIESHLIMKPLLLALPTTLGRLAYYEFVNYFRFRFAFFSFPLFSFGRKNSFKHLVVRIAGHLYQANAGVVGKERNALNESLGGSNKSISKLIIVCLRCRLSRMCRLLLYAGSIVLFLKNENCFPPYRPQTNAHSCRNNVGCEFIIDWFECLFCCFFFVFLRLFLILVDPLEHII